MRSGRQRQRHDLGAGRRKAHRRRQGAGRAIRLVIGHVAIPAASGQPALPSGRADRPRRARPAPAGREPVSMASKPACLDRITVPSSCAVSLARSFTATPDPDQAAVRAAPPAKKAGCRDGRDVCDAYFIQKDNSSWDPQGTAVSTSGPAGGALSTADGEDLDCPAGNSGSVAPLSGARCSPPRNADAILG